MEIKEKEEKNQNIFTDTVTAKRYDLYITGPIKEANIYLDMFDTIKKAESTDIVRIFFNSPGGDVWTAVQFIAAIHHSDANVEGIIEGECHSAASLIFLCCNSFDVPQWASMLCHFYSVGCYGKAHEIDQWHKHVKPHIRNIFCDIYKGFFNQKELDRMANGEDFWLDGLAIAKRLKIKVALEEKEEKALLAEKKREK
jgi:ATP-dependent protease ClpP protease subunit